MKLVPFLWLLALVYVSNLLIFRLQIIKKYKKRNFNKNKKKIYTRKKNEIRKGNRIETETSILF